MKIAYGGFAYDPNYISGGNAHIYHFINASTQLGHEVWCWPGDNHPLSNKLPNAYVARTLKLREMDAILFRLEWEPPGPLHWSTGLRRKFLDQIKVVWEFNTVPEYGRYQGVDDQRIAKAIGNFKKYSHGCDLAICVSTKIAEYVKTHLNIRNVLPVTNGSDPDLFRPDLDPITRVRREENKINIVWIGSADIGWHDLDILCEAAKIIWERSNRDRFRFHIIGRGLKNIRNFPENVNYHGAEEYENLPYWLSAMDVGLVLYKDGPADFSSPLKLFDYMSSGLAVIGIEHPQLKEIFLEMNQMDLLVPRNNPAQLAQKIIYLEENRDRIRHQGLAGRKLILEKYNWDKITSKIIDSIEGLYSNNASNLNTT